MQKLPALTARLHREERANIYFIYIYSPRDLTLRGIFEHYRVLCDAGPQNSWGLMGWAQLNSVHFVKAGHGKSMVITATTEMSQATATVGIDAPMQCGAINKQRL